MRYVLCMLRINIGPGSADRVHLCVRHTKASEYAPSAVSPPTNSPLRSVTDTSSGKLAKPKKTTIKKAAPCPACFVETAYDGITQSRLFVDSRIRKLSV